MSDQLQDILSQYITYRSDKMVVYTLPNSVHIDISKSIRQFKEQDIFSRVEAEYHAGRNSYQITTWLKVDEFAEREKDLRNRQMAKIEERSKIPGEFTVLMNGWSGEITIKEKE